MTVAEKVAKGITILMKYPNCEIAAGHDEIWFGPEDSSLVTEKDQKLLESLGWYYSEDFSSWSRTI